MALETTRRGLITGLIAFAAAPTIVRASSLMPVKVMKAAEPSALGALYTEYFGSGGTFYRTDRIIWMVDNLIYVEACDGSLEVWEPNRQRDPLFHASGETPC